MCFGLLGVTSAVHGERRRLRDYAVAKFFALRRSHRRCRMRIIILFDNNRGEYHAVWAWRWAGN